MSDRNLEKELQYYIYNDPEYAEDIENISYPAFFETRIQDFQMIKFPITYTAGRRKKTETGFEAKPATEILIYN